MPLKQCGDGGWKWGDSGKCYEGPGGKKKAIAQALAIGGGEMPKEASVERMHDARVAKLRRRARV